MIQRLKMGFSYNNTPKEHLAILQNPSIPLKKRLKVDLSVDCPETLLFFNY